jgi:hypothetical protein
MPNSHNPTTGYECNGLPDHPVGDLDLMKIFRSRVGNDVVNEQVAKFGADRVITLMRRAHRSHLTALTLTPRQLHQRAELVESLMDEFRVPAALSDGGEDPQVQVDSDRIQMLIRMVKELADRAVEAAMMNEATMHILMNNEEEFGGAESE